eukprot:3851630-Pleurochrysis_carterae.AAC.2
MPGIFLELLQARGDVTETQTSQPSNTGTGRAQLQGRSAAANGQSAHQDQESSLGELQRAGRNAGLGEIASTRAVPPTAPKPRKGA